MIKKLKRMAIKVKNRKQRHAVLILDHGRIVSQATNKKGHAERVALGFDIANIDKVTKTVTLATSRRFKGCTLISFRAKPCGEIGNSKPCEDCDRAINEAGIRKVVYHDGERWIEEYR